MNNKDLPTLPTMQTVRTLTEILIDKWCDSICPDPCECNKCKYKELCAKIEELVKVVNK